MNNSFQVLAVATMVNLKVGELHVAMSDNRKYMHEMAANPEKYPHAMEVKDILVKLFDSDPDLKIEFIVRFVNWL